MTLSLDLEVCQASRRSHQAQIEPRLAQLSQSIAQQIQALDAEEHGSIEQSAGVIAQLIPVNPMDYRWCEFEQQQYELAYQLKPTHRWSELPAPQFTELDWSIEQQEQLRQELSCVLAVVGDLLTLHPLVATFRYPMRRSID